jgi:trehalose-phosphatase
VAVHYRRATDERRAGSAILAAVSTLVGARHIHGDRVVEVLPVLAPNKGDALSAIRRGWKPQATLYVGDDVTDEDAFTSAGPGALLSVRVGGERPTAALFRLDAQAEIEAVLQTLAALARRTDVASSRRRR